MVPTLKLVNLLVMLRRLPPLSELTGEEERFLFELHQVWERQGSLSISDVYDLVTGKSSSTAYRLLMGLRDKRLVVISVNEEDKRRRQITFTDTAKNLFGVMT